MFRFGARNTLVLLSSSQQGWARFAATFLFLSWLQHWVSWDGAGFWCVVHFLSNILALPLIGIAFTSNVTLLLTHLLDGNLAYPQFTSRKIRLVTAHAPHFWQHPGIQQCTWDLAGFPSSVLPCQKQPPSVLRVAQEVWEGAEISLTGAFNHWPIFLTLLPGRHWKSTYLGWLIPSKNPNYFYCYWKRLEYHSSHWLSKHVRRDELLNVLTGTFILSSPFTDLHEPWINHVTNFLKTK